MEYRISLSHAESGANRNEAVVVALHPSETMEHMTLRVLAWCLLPDERLGFGPGLDDPDGADLWSHDLTGRVSTWVECGNVDPDKLRKIVRHHAGVTVHVILDDERRREELAQALVGWKRPKGDTSVVAWVVERALVQALAEREERRRHWSVTYVGDHLYIDDDGAGRDGEVTRSRLL